ncbi:WD repeat-containing protein 82-B-like isoform X1 [Hibiscus syriacus]|uniref:WD repeat-containing protein 82-B-like isoform X1 n=1 Tax=Hibiscus syriacus TaxID=106335 RepID=A0A6A2Z823_HIBSY|nr:uncharacterized protein LOC120149441 [Hibiscus syriacus]KAE8688038.1 WD repeat-containing protein 82-B-like isoform X1 [Hibiscus syriacus]
MAEISRSRPVRFLLIFASVYLQFTPGFSDDSKASDNSSKTNSSTAVIIVIILCGLVAVGLISFFLFKLWQKKKRDEQYARLLKLFEEDDELEFELGLRTDSIICKLCSSYLRKLDFLVAIYQDSSIPCGEVR